MPSINAVHMVSTVTSNPEQFGRSVSILTGPTLILVVGAPKWDGGRAYVYDTSGSLLEVKMAPDKTNGDLFGHSVATHGPGHYYVGAPGNDDGNGFDSGSVYIFEGTTLVSEITAVDVEALDRFGESIAAADSLLLVGAPTNRTGIGSVYLFTDEGTELDKLEPSDGIVGMDFGSAVTLTTDIIVVGAKFHLNGIDAIGAVYLFDAKTSSFITKIVPSDGGDKDRFGTSLAILDGTIAIGSPGNSNANGVESGAVYLYGINGVFIQKIIAPDGRDGDRFGRSVAITSQMIAVSARENHFYGPDGGAVYIFDENGLFLQKIHSPNGEANDRFGWDLVADENNFLIGAYLEKIPTGATGGAYYHMVEIPSKSPSVQPSKSPSVQPSKSPSVPPSKGGSGIIIQS